MSFCRCRSLISLRIQVEMHSRVASGAMGKPVVGKLPFNIAALRARWQNSVKRYHIKVMAYERYYIIIQRLLRAAP